MFVRKLENFLEDRIEGFFNKKFSSSLRIDEIENRLEKEFYLKKKTRDEKAYAPDDYTIVVGESDYENLNCPETYQRLYRFLLQSAIRKDFFFEDKIQLRLALNMIKDPGCFSIQALYQDRPKMEVGPPKLPVEEEGRTLVFQKTAADKNFIDFSRLLFARLIVTEGVDLDTALSIGEKRIHIGRRESSEVCLQDKSCSRLHAYISFEQYRHVLYDASSLNGMRVNQRSVRQHVLRPGDKIGIGNTVILYEVN